MATIQNNYEPTLEYEGFSGLFDQGHDYSSAPRGHILADLDRISIPVSAVGDNNLVIVDINLPRNFAYSIADCYFEIATAGLALNTYFPTGGATWQDGEDQTNKTYSIPIPLNGFGPAPVGGNPGNSLIYIMNKQPSGVLRPNVSTFPKLRLTFYQEDSDDIEQYFINGFARFLQFNIEQAYNYEVNSPIPVRG